MCLWTDYRRGPGACQEFWRKTLAAYCCQMPLAGVLPGADRRACPVAPNSDLAETVYLWYTRDKTMPDGTPDLAAGWVGENQ